MVEGILDYWEKNKHQKDLYLVFKNCDIQIKEILGKMKDLPLEEKRKIGPKIITAKEYITKSFKEIEEQRRLNEYERYNDLSGSCKDFPSFLNVFQGSVNPLSCTISQLHHIMQEMGFIHLEGNQIESEFYNFDALNIPKNHPSRTSHDTFFVGDRLLRTHTTPTEIHALKEINNPTKIYAIGKVFRNDNNDSTHYPMFHQMEGMYAMEDACIPTLFHTLERIFGKFFDKQLKIRFRPSFFPFTVPSYEIDVALKNGIPLENGSSVQDFQWLELGGCGMLHPNVLQACDLPYRRIFAWGVGVERLCTTKYHIKDVRKIFDGRGDVIQSVGLAPGFHLLQMMGGKI